MADFSPLTYQLVGQLANDGLWDKMTEDQQRRFIHESEAKYYGNPSDSIVKMVTREKKPAIPDYSRAKKEHKIANLYVPKAKEEELLGTPVLEIPAEAARIIIEPVSARKSIIGKEEPRMMTRPAEQSKSDTPIVMPPIPPKPTDTLKPEQVPIVVPPKPTQEQPKQEQQKQTTPKQEQSKPKDSSADFKNAARQFIIATAQANGATSAQASELAKQFIDSGKWAAIQEGIETAMGNAINSPRPEPAQPPATKKEKQAKQPAPTPAPQPQPEAAAEAFNASNFVNTAQTAQSNQVPPEIVNPALRLLNARNQQSNQQPQQVQAPMPVNYPAQWATMSSYDKCGWIESLLRSYPASYPQVHDPWATNVVDDKARIAGLKNYYTFLGIHPKMHHLEFVALTSLLGMAKLHNKMSSAGATSTVDNPKLEEIPVTKYASNLSGQFNWAFEMELTDPNKVLVIYLNSVPEIDQNTGQWRFPTRMEVYNKKKPGGNGKGKAQPKPRHVQPDPNQPDPNTVTVGQVIDADAGTTQQS